jgi:hypothetical protein
MPCKIAIERDLWILHEIQMERLVPKKTAAFIKPMTPSLYLPLFFV